ncbi:hypothetical protein BH11PSE3_BH11PSE3_15980 [soil metagenome]
MGLIELFGWPLDLQFEPDSKGGFLYRHDNIGAPIAVTAAERADFVRAFGWKFLAHVAGLMLAVIAAAMATAHYFPKGDETGGFLLMGGFLVAIVAALYLWLKWAMAAPLRALAGRPTVGPARTRAEVTRPYFAKLTYARIAGRAATIAIAAPFLAIESIGAAIAALVLALVAFLAMAFWK